MAKAREKAAQFSTLNPIRPSPQTGGNPIRPQMMPHRDVSTGQFVRPPSLEAIQRKLAEKKEQLQASLNPSSMRHHGSTQQGEHRAKGGLNVEYHPALMMDVTTVSSKNAASGKASSLANRSAPSLPLFSTVMANERVVNELRQQEEVQKELQIDRKIPVEFKDVKNNPYLDPHLKTGAAPKQRNARQFKFVEHGTYMEIAKQQRAQAALEKLKRDIAETIKKTGMEKEIELVSDKAIRVKFNVFPLVMA